MPENITAEEAEQIKSAVEAAPPKRPRFKPCRIRGCDEPGKHRETGYCTAHYGRYLNAKRAGAV